MATIQRVNFQQGLRRSAPTRRGLVCVNMKKVRAVSFAAVGSPAVRAGLQRQTRLGASPSSPAQRSASSASLP